MTASGTRLRIWSAARPMQGAVFRPTGSMRMFSAGISGSWRISSAAWLRPVTIRVRSARNQRPDPVDGFADDRPLAQDVQEVLGHPLPAPGPEPRPLSPGHDDGKHRLSSPFDVWIGVAHPEKGGAAPYFGNVKRRYPTRRRRDSQPEVAPSPELDCQIIGSLIGFKTIFVCRSVSLRQGGDGLS